MASLKALALNHEVVERAKLVDIKPLGETGELLIETWNIDETGPEFRVPACDAQDAMLWRKWDRLSWVSDPELRGNGEFVMRRRFARLGDISREPSPGTKALELPSFDRSPYDADRFLSSLDSAFTYAKRGDTDGFAGRSWAEECLRLVEKTRDKAFVRKGRVAEDGSVVTEGITLRTPPPGVWDPELIASMKPGTAVEVWLVVRSDVRTPADVLASDYPCRLEWYVAKITPPPSKRPG